MMLRAKTKLLVSLKRINYYSSSIHKNHVISDHAKFQALGLSSNITQHQLFSSPLGWEASSNEVLLKKLDLALNNNQIHDAWDTFNDFTTLYGFPSSSVLNKFVNVLSYSFEPYWLNKGYSLAVSISNQKSGLLHQHVLTKLSLSLARAQIPESAAMILGLMLEKMKMPSTNVLWQIVLHMVRTEIGTCLVSNFLIELCEQFLVLSAEKNHNANMMKPDTMIFNLVLDGCWRFRSSLKGHQIIELMARTGIIADAQSIVIISRIHEMNGLRDEVKKFKHYVDRVSRSLNSHYIQFYESLLSLHFKFDDIDAAADLVLYMCRDRECVPVPEFTNSSLKVYAVPIGSHNLKAELKIQIMPELLNKDSVLVVGGNQELVVFKKGKLLPTNKCLATLIYGYKTRGMIGELSTLLLAIQKELGGSSLCSDVIAAFIHLGWLENAHDILDDMELSENSMSLATYMSLLKAYQERNMFRESNALVNQMKKVGMLINTSEDMFLNASSIDPTLHKSDLIDCLVQERRKVKENNPPMLYNLNSSVYFFSKAKMIDDALKTYRKMQDMKFQPMVQTFAFLAFGYSSMQMYRDIAHLWGSIKRNMKSGNSIANRDLFELLLLNFLRGGYFERVMEVIDFMEKRSMYTDKWMYKNEFLKFHKNLYRNLRASECRSEAQSKRLEHVQAFRKWVGIHSSLK